MRLHPIFLTSCLILLCSCNESTETQHESICGNGVLETGEGCDGAIPNHMTCATVLGEGATGALSSMLLITWLVTSDQLPAAS